MTWRERRINTILGVILAILAAALLIVLSIRYRSARMAAEEGGETLQGETATPAVTEGYTSVRYRNGTLTLSFTMDEQERWHWADDLSFPLESTHLKQILNTVSTLTPQQALSEHEELDQYDLDDPCIIFTASTADGRTLTLAFGKTTTDGNSYYALMNEDPSTVYIFSDELVRQMDKPIYDMMVLPALPALARKDISTITLEGPAGEGEQSGTITLLSNTGGSSGDAWRSGGANVTSSPQLQALLADLEQLSLQRCVDYRPSEEAASICGFDDPAARVLVMHRAGDDTETPFRLTVGNSLPDGSGRYVRVDEDPSLYLVSDDLLDSLIAVAAEGLVS